MDILRALLPLVLASLLVLYVLQRVKKVQGRNRGEEEEENFMTEGMAIGLCLGTGISIALGQENIGIGASIGLFYSTKCPLSIKKGGAVSGSV